MQIVPQSATFSSTYLLIDTRYLLPAPPKRLMLPAPPPRLMLPAPKIAGLLPAPASITVPATIPAAPKKKVVTGEIVNSEMLYLDDIDALLAELDKNLDFRTNEEADAELDALVPGWRRYLGDDDDEETWVDRMSDAEFDAWIMRGTAQ